MRMEDNNKITLKDIVVDGVDSRDYPDFCDAFMTYAERMDGTPLTDEELDVANDSGDYSCEIHEAAFESFQ